MKTILAAIALVAAATCAVAEPVTIYTGGKGGGYDAAAQTMAARMAQRGYEVTVENRNGSDDITLQACRDENAVWIAQIDALYAREMKDGCFLPVVADYGTEVAALFFAPGSRMNDLGDLDGGKTIFVDKVGSGSELTWRTMVAIELEHGRGDDWTKAQTETSDLRRATAMANRGKVHAALLVRKESSADFQMLIDQGWELGDLSDKDINDLKYGSKPLYERTKVRIGKAKDNGYLVPSFIGTTEHIERDEIDLFDAILGAVE